MAAVYFRLLFLVLNIRQPFLVIKASPEIAPSLGFESAAPHTVGRPVELCD